MSSLSQLAQRRQGRAGDTDTRGSHSSPDLLQRTPCKPPWQYQSPSAGNGHRGTVGVGSTHAPDTSSDGCGRAGTSDRDCEAQWSGVQGNSGAVSRGDSVIQGRVQPGDDCSNVAGAGVQATRGGLEQGSGVPVKGGALDVSCQRSSEVDRCAGHDARTGECCSSDLGLMQGREGVEAGEGRSPVGNVRSSRSEEPPVSREARQVPCSDLVQYWRLRNAVRQRKTGIAGSVLAADTWPGPIKSTAAKAGADAGATYQQGLI
eukprot:1150051-Pelagomonas_calceolata.AAC.7